MHINSVHVEERILEKLFICPNKSKDRMSKRSNDEHLAQQQNPHTIIHN
jgi:hypothetical protein